MNIAEIWDLSTPFPSKKPINSQLSEKTVQFFVECLFLMHGLLGEGAAPLPIPPATHHPHNRQ